MWRWAIVFFVACSRNQQENYCYLSFLGWIDDQCKVAWKRERKHLTLLGKINMARYLVSDSRLCFVSREIMCDPFSREVDCGWCSHWCSSRYRLVGCPPNLLCDDRNLMHKKKEEIKKEKRILPYDLRSNVDSSRYMERLGFNNVNIPTFCVVYLGRLFEVVPE